MKKRLISFMLVCAVCLALTALPASAAIPSKLKLAPGEARNVAADTGGRDYAWSSSNGSVATVQKQSLNTATITAGRPGTAVITVTFTLQRPDIRWNSATERYEHIYVPYTQTERCTVIVTDPNTGEAPALTINPPVSYGEVGQDVSGIITGIKGFNHGMVPVRYNGLWGFANAELELLIPFQFDDEGELDNYNMVNDTGYIAVCVGRQKYVINTDGEPVYADSGTGIAAVVSCNKGYISVQRYYDRNTWMWENYDFEGNELSKTQAVSLRSALERRQEEWGDLVHVGDDGTSFYDRGTNYLFAPPTSGLERSDATLKIPQNGKEVWIPENYGSYQRFQEGVLVLRDPETRRYGAVDKTGSTVIPFQYDRLYASRDGYISYQKGTEFGLLENPVEPPTGEVVRPNTSTTPTQPALPEVEPIPAVGTAVATTQTVRLDGRAVVFQTYSVKDANGNDTNYVKLRDLAYALNGTRAQFNVVWDGKVIITSNTAYVPNGTENVTPYSGSQTYTSVSGEPVRFNGSEVKLTSFRIRHSTGGYTYYKLRDLGQLLNFEVRWDDSAKSVVIETGKPYAGK